MKRRDLLKAAAILPILPSLSDAPAEPPEVIDTTGVPKGLWLVPLSPGWYSHGIHRHGHWYSLVGAHWIKGKKPTARWALEPDPASPIIQTDAKPLFSACCINGITLSIYAKGNPANSVLWNRYYQLAEWDWRLLRYMDLEAVDFANACVQK